MEPKEFLVNVLRPKLISFEDSIVFNLLERAQFKRNEVIYVPGKFEGTSGQSFFDFLSKGTEELYAKAGKFNDSEEYPSSQELDEPVVKRDSPERYIPRAQLNLNGRIRDAYFEFVGGICEEGDDREYGSSAIIDIRILNCLSKRIHMGTQVAEAKFRADLEMYSELIREGDVEGITEALTNKNVELTIHERVKFKAGKFQEAMPGDCRFRNYVDPEKMKELYERLIIPITIEAELEYFDKRLE